MTGECSNSLLELALAGDLPAPEADRLHQHLETCEACSRAIEEMSGGPQWCQEAAKLLATDEIDATAITRDEWSEIDFSVEHLEPSEEPNVLGCLGGYDILEIVGRGGMGIVLKAYDRELKRCVALKVLAPHLAQSSLAKKRFAREAQAAAAVVHPHVLAIHQVQPNGRLPFLVMPLVAGESLAHRLSAQGTLELIEILRIGMQAAAGLAAAHEQGLVHRDVKPANILLEKGIERAVLTDFGLARAADDVALTRWGVIAGTPQYMSPEQAKGEAVDARSDLFSLGCVLYEMATGISPFRTETTMATLRRLIDDAPQPLAARNPELPPWFCAIVMRLLEKDPAKRYSSAKEVSELLEGCLAHVQQPANVPLPEGLPKTPRRRVWTFSKRRSIKLAALVALGLGITITAFMLLTTPPDISGEWTGEDWGQVVLTPAAATGEYTGTYSETFDKETPGKLQLRWSRIERQYTGTWGEEKNRFGDISLRLVDNEIRGAYTTDPKSKINPDTPHLTDLHWVRPQSVAIPGDLDPDKAVQFTTEGWQLWNAGQMDAATAKFQEALKLDPKNTHAQNGLGWAAWKSAKTKEAIAVFEALLKTEPKHPGALNGLGQLYLAERDYNKAEKYFLQAEPSAPAAWYGLAKLYLLQGKFGEAEKWAKKIVDSGDDEGNQLLAAALANTLSPELRQLIEPSGANLGQAWILMNQGRRTEAFQIFEELIAKSPEDANVLNGLGWFHLSGNDLEKAKPFFERALKLDPNATGSMNGLARILKAQGNTDSAITLWEELVRKVPGINAGTYGLAETYFETGNYEKAVPFLEQILKTQPDDQATKTKLEKARAAIDSKNKNPGTPLSVKLPHGGEVVLHALGKRVIPPSFVETASENIDATPNTPVTLDPPGIGWAPDGTTLSGTRYRELFLGRHFIANIQDKNRPAAIYEFIHTGSIGGFPALHIISGEPYRYDGPYYGAQELLQPINGIGTPLFIGFGVGEWTPRGNISVGKAFKNGDFEFKIDKLEKIDGKWVAWYSRNLFSQFEVKLIIVDDRGCRKEGLGGWHIPVPRGLKDSATVLVDVVDKDGVRYELLTRPRYWVSFSNFASGSEQVVEHAHLEAKNLSAVEVEQIATGLASQHGQPEVSDAPTLRFLTEFVDGEIVAWKPDGSLVDQSDDIAFLSLSLYRRGSLFSKGVTAWAYHPRWKHDPERPTPSSIVGPQSGNTLASSVGLDVANPHWFVSPFVPKDEMEFPEHADIQIGNDVDSSKAEPFTFKNVAMHPNIRPIAPIIAKPNHAESVQGVASPRLFPSTTLSATPPTYGPVIERTIYDVPPDLFFDLDTNTYIEPKEKVVAQDSDDEVNKYGIDIMGDDSSAVRGLVCFDMIVLPTENKDWDAPANESASFILAQQKPGSLTTMSGRGELPVTYRFQTREGSQGLLQIVGHTEEGAAKIRYKLVQKRVSIPKTSDAPRSYSAKEITKDKSLEAALRQFNESTAEDRRTLFDPPIPDLTLDRLRDGFLRQAELYRREKDFRVAAKLEKIARTGRMPDEAYNGLFGTGVMTPDEDDHLSTAQIAPALALDNAGGTGKVVVVLRTLELIYRKDGLTSKDYGDLFDFKTGQMKVPKAPESKLTPIPAESKSIAPTQSSDQAPPRQPL